MRKVCWEKSSESVKAKAENVRKTEKFQAFVDELRRNFELVIEFRVENISLILLQLNKYDIFKDNLKFLNCNF